MRKLLITLLACTATAAYAVPVDCIDTLSASPTLAALIATNAGGGCFHQDKIFSDFVYTGLGATEQPADQVAATHVFQQAVQEIHGFLQTLWHT